MILAEKTRLYTHIYSIPTNKGRKVSPPIFRPFFYCLYITVEITASCHRKTENGSFDRRFVSLGVGCRFICLR
jgi:hypothetical protein